jgi:hypothetical protein
MSRSKKKTPGVVAKGGKPLVKVTSGRRPKTCGELAALWPTLAKVPAEEAVRFERDLKLAKNNFSPGALVRSRRQMAKLMQTFTPDESTHEAPPRR